MGIVTSTGDDPLGRDGRAMNPIPDSAGADQGEVFAFLADPRTHSLPVPIHRIDTHGAVVFLAGPDAYKVKRAVRFPFLDYSTLALRKAACEAELEVNRTNAPALYLGTIPVTRSGDGLALGGQGEPVEWAVHMRRFDESRTLDHLHRAEGLSPDIAKALAAAVADSHRRAAPATGERWIPSLARFIAEAREALLAHPALFDREEVEAAAAAQHGALDRLRPLLLSRSAGGHVRRIHGDLHLGNIVLLGSEPILFDAIEFSEDIATGDILYDLAFLLMDLWVRGDTRSANLVFNRHLHLMNPEEQLPGIAALPLFLSVRAAIRAHVTAARSLVVDERERPEVETAARTYLRAAGDVLRPCPAAVVAIGGLSGTGKSTVSACLAPSLGPQPGAVHLRSDLERKRLFGADETARLPAEAYGQEVTARIYARLGHLAQLAARAGSAVVVDAVHARLEEREAIEAVAREAGAAFLGIWLALPAEERVRRVESRTGDASDAGPKVALAQEGYDTGPIAWTTLDASRPAADIAAEIAALARKL
jgi:aminoglycoside phosphotransferase family enzyme/predicted kinase